MKREKSRFIFLEGVYMTRKNRKMTIQVMLMIIMIIMGFTPLGSIPLPFMKATTTHIPVIIAAILFGVKSGAVFGFVFGIISMLRSTFMPNLTSFAFTPFIAIPGVDGFNWQAIIIAFIPRILIGVIVSLLYTFLKNKKVNPKINFMISGVVGSMVNTVFVLGLIYILMGEAYANAQQIAIPALFSMLMGVVFTNGIGEAIVAAICVSAVLIALFKAIPDIESLRDK